jgi:hypothetical protein
MSIKIDVKTEIQNYKNNIKEREEQNTRDMGIIEVLQDLLNMGITELSSSDAPKTNITKYPTNTPKPNIPKYPTNTPRIIKH